MSASPARSRTAARKRVETEGSEAEIAARETLAMHRSYVEKEVERVDREVRLIPYNGFPSDSVGRNGDLVLDQLNNTIYGPKANGVWPLEGMQVEGPVMSARSRVRLSTIREGGETQIIRTTLAGRVKGLLRFLLTGRSQSGYRYSVHFKE